MRVALVAPVPASPLQTTQPEGVVRGGSQQVVPELVHVVDVRAVVLRLAPYIPPPPHVAVVEQARCQQASPKVTTESNSAKSINRQLRYTVSVRARHCQRCI